MSNGVGKGQIGRAVCFVCNELELDFNFQLALSVDVRFLSQVHVCRLRLASFLLDHKQLVHPHTGNATWRRGHWQLRELYAQRVLDRIMTSLSGMQAGAAATHGYPHWRYPT